MPCWAAPPVAVDSIVTASRVKMDRINHLLNAVVSLLLVVATGYMVYASSGFGLLPVTSPPDDAWFRSTVLQCSRPVVVKLRPLVRTVPHDRP